MNNHKFYKILYYISFTITLCFILFYFYCDYKIADITVNFKSPIVKSLFLLNLILFSIFNFQLVKRKISNPNIVATICYITFLIITTIIMFIYNDILIIPYIHLEYYTILILIAFILLNIYSLLSIEKKKK